MREANLPMLVRIASRTLGPHKGLGLLVVNGNELGDGRFQHRITSTTYPAGTYASVTPSKYFVYDNATVDSVAMANAKTRLAEAYTCISTCSPKSTDLGLSYTARGETSDTYESTPNSGGYYHSSATYWANGALNQLSNSIGYYLAYGVDGEGRAYSTTDGGGAHPLASTLYNYASQPTQVNLGYSGDSDSYSYDANTNRMTQYKFNVNGQSVTGNLSWNAVGTLSSLGISDPFSSSNNQTCSYSHDDLTRIANANCGSVWAQSFVYDAFGNIDKTGNSSFNPFYSSATNRMTQIGSSTPSYDANGNVTNDFLHTYAWDSNGRPVTIDGVGVTYDALGSMVEQNRSGAYTQMIYTPTGFLMETVNGQSYQYAFSPMPGGGETVWSAPAGIVYYRHADWLGSSRFASTSSRTMYYDGAYAPFGEQYANSGTSDLSFTGMDQDTSSNLYDFPAREYGIQGRWPSPDPAGIAAVDPSNPQTWNRYAYVANNPLAITDPTGLIIPVIVPPTPDPSGISDAAIGIFDLLSFLFELLGGGPPPQATPAPPGGYGAGIDPYGTWTEQVPAGVQVFPSSVTGIPNGSGCTYGQGSCGGGVYGFQGPLPPEVWDEAGEFVIGYLFGERRYTSPPKSRLAKRRIMRRRISARILAEGKATPSLTHRLIREETQLVTAYPVLRAVLLGHSQAINMALLREHIGTGLSGTRTRLLVCAIPRGNLGRRHHERGKDADARSDKCDGSLPKRCSINLERRILDSTGITRLGLVGQVQRDKKVVIPCPRCCDSRGGTSSHNPGCAVGFGSGTDLDSSASGRR